jgi:hypothetical protein
MAELDAWTDQVIIEPLHEAVIDGDSVACDATCSQVKHACRRSHDRPVPAKYPQGLNPAKKKI